ncbi:MAG: tetratricopeptide repeat protein [Aureliella sp.]
MSNRLKILIGVLLILAAVLLLPFLTTRGGRDQSDIISQKLAKSQAKTDNIRNAMRYLRRMTPLNRQQTSKEVQLELNTWIQTADLSKAKYKPSRLLENLPPDMLDFVGCKSAIELQFSSWDVDYLFERRMMNKLASWVVNFPLRDSFVSELVEKEKASLSAEDGLRLEEACKLFDWVTRNVALEPELASVEQKLRDPSGPVVEQGPGYGYLPWETLLFSFGDFVERGHVFTSLAMQRDIPVAWIADSGDVWAIAVLISDKIFVLEPKLGMPIVDPDKVTLATLAEVQTNPRILRRLDLPGQFDYAYNAGDLKSPELLIDLPPTASSARMKLLEQNLVRDERMRVYFSFDELAEQFQSVAPDMPVKAWSVPLQAQIHAAGVRDQLRTVSDFTLRYMSQHGIWMMDNPAANGRLNHLLGVFESEINEKGALSLYMDCRFDDESLRQLTYNPAVQQELGIPRQPGEEKEQHDRKVQQAQIVFRKAKVDAAFLMAQLHFDRGNYDAAENWFSKRVIDNQNPLAAKWNAIARYSLARIYQEQGEIDKAAEQLTFEDSPMEAGNRLRLRYLRKLAESEEAEAN